MTPVIACCVWTRHHDLVSLDSPPFDVGLLASLLRPPDGQYLAIVDRTRAAAGPVAPDAARHFAMFAERVRGMDEPELEELYRESFAPADAVALRHAADQLCQAGPAARECALSVLGGLLGPLEAARNPFAVLFKALCVVLLSPDAPNRTRRT